MPAVTTSDTMPPMPRVHMMLQAIPLVTSAMPTAAGATRTEATLTQALVMARGAFWDGHAVIEGVANAEGLAMADGELNTGAYGEGFVDRRHPHAYLHELVATGLGAVGLLSLSATAGRGFAPFGTDDPMMRPLVKYPVNHHLAQVLERSLFSVAARLGPVLGEAGMFGGDEPTSPSSLPRAARFGDSWSARLTALPASGVEVQSSLAHVASPEEASGFGLDQRKQSYSARAITGDGARYLLVEWARTVERDHDRNQDAFAHESALAEGAIQARRLGLALRLEQTDRPEEERLADPSRTARPAHDLSISGITRWRVMTVHGRFAPVTAGSVSGYPFLEVARLWATPHDERTVFQPAQFYGTTRFWMLTAGVRLRAGGAHSRMGRYGVALADGPAIRVMGESSNSHHEH